MNLFANMVKLVADTDEAARVFSVNYANGYVTLEAQVGFEHRPTNVADEVGDVKVSTSYMLRPWVAEHLARLLLEALPK